MRMVYSIKLSVSPRFASALTPAFFIVSTAIFMVLIKILRSLNIT